MNATLSLKGGVNTPATLAPNREPSKAEQARRLELFEIALREERIAELEDRIDFYEEQMTSEQETSHYQITTLERMLKDSIDLGVRKLKIQEGDILVASAEFAEREDVVKAIGQMIQKLGLKNVGMVCGHIDTLDEEARRKIAEPFLADLRAKATKLQLERQKLTDYNAELEAAGNQLADDKEQLLAKIDRLKSQANARDQVIETALAGEREAKAELKRLKQLDPDGMRKRLDKHKKKAAELDAANTDLRAKNNALTKENRKLHLALDKACADINAAQKLEPIRVIEHPSLGRWELYSCERNGFYQVLDVENEVSRTVHIDDNVMIQPKQRRVPQAVAKWVVGVHNEYFGGQNNG